MHLIRLERLMTKNSFQSIDLVDDEPEMILIKEEAFEDCQGESNLHIAPRSDKSMCMKGISQGSSLFVCF